MGADYERGRVLAGVAIAYSAGEGSYTEADARGEVESTLLSAYPYLRYTLSERLSVWGVLGLGEGGLTLDVERNDERIETDISLAMAAFGARGRLAFRRGLRPCGQDRRTLRADRIGSGHGTRRGGCAHAAPAPGAGGFARGEV